MKKIILILSVVLVTIGLTACGKSDNTSISKEVFDGEIKNNALAINSTQSMAVVGKSESNKLSVFDLQLNKKIKELDQFVTPRNIAFSKDGKSFFVSDSSLGNIQEIDIETFKTKKIYKLKKGVFGFTLTNDGKKLLANNQYENTVTILDLSSGNQTIIEGFDGPRQGILIDSVDQLAYVTNFKSDDVKVLELKTQKIIKTLKNIPSVRAISLNEKNNTLYGASSSENSINLVDTQTGELIKKIPVGQEPYGCKLSKEENILLTGEKESNQVSVIDTNRNEVIRTITGLQSPR